MNRDQVILLGVLAAALALFAWNRWRYDLVALLALLAVALAGLVPPGEVFMGLGHPAVVTVAAVLVLSRGLLNAGVVDAVARQLTRVGDTPWIQVATLTGIVALCSGVMNNVGALALLMPVAIWMARRSGRSPSFLLMPLAFGSLLGGTLTLIGTPPNIIVAAYRQQACATPFKMFDFLPVGLSVTLAGVGFIALCGWRLTPWRRRHDAAAEMFKISAYLTELRVPPQCRFVGRTLYGLITSVKGEAEIVVVALVRAGQMREMPPVNETLCADDVLLVEVDSDSLKALIDVTGLELAAQSQDPERQLAPDKLTLAEAIVTPGSRLAGRTPIQLGLRARHGMNVLAVARQGRRLREQLGKISFAVGDILLVQGDRESLPGKFNELGCLPLAARGLRIGRPRQVLLASAIFGVALTLIAAELVPPATALIGGAVAMVLAGLIAPNELYQSLDMPVIVLLAAMMPVGQALERTGGAQLIADAVLVVGKSAPPVATLVVLMVTVMLLSNVVNNAAAALLAAPIAVGLAQGLGVSVDPFLMAVVIGASCAFLTPIGHQSNALVMAPGGYRFGDYWRLGLPLSVVVIGVAVPAILWFWPL